MYADYIQDLEQKKLGLRRQIEKIDDEITLFISLKQEGIKDLYQKDIKELQKSLSDKENLLLLA